MKKMLFLFAILYSFIVGCSNDAYENREIDYAQYNQSVINYLQRKYNVESQVEFAPDYKQRLTREAVENLEEYYKFIGAMKESPMKMSCINMPSRSRGTGVQTESFNTTLSYELDGINLTIYYDVDIHGKIADDPRIYAGLWGEGVSKNYTSGWYTVNGHRSSCTASADKIWVDVVRADYVVLFYNNMEYKFIDGQWTLVPDLQSGLYARQRIKLAATGSVDLANNQSGFTMHYAGAGSWGLEDL